MNEERNPNQEALLAFIGAMSPEQRQQMADAGMRWPGMTQPSVVKANCVNELAPGETIRLRITNNVHFDMKSTGYGLSVVCTEGIGVNKVDANHVILIGDGSLAAEDLGAE